MTQVQIQHAERIATEALGLHICEMDQDEVKSYDAQNKEILHAGHHCGVRSADNRHADSRRQLVE